MKTFITSGMRANFVTTAVRTGGPGPKGVSLLLIDTSTPGFTVSKKIHKMGWHSSDTGELSFVDCRVPVENLLGKEGEGFKGIMINFQSERLYRDSRILSIGGGTTEIMKEIVGKMI
jgi:acyl-CoA dehydrogenase